MAKISLTQDPEFKCDVGILIKGLEKPVPIKFTFKARTKDEMKAWMASFQGSDKKLVDAALDCAIGWELEDAFGKDNLEKLEQNYMGSLQNIINTYIDEHQGARKGN